MQYQLYVPRSGPLYSGRRLRNTLIETDRCLSRHSAGHFINRHFLPFPRLKVFAFRSEDFSPVPNKTSTTLQSLLCTFCSRRNTIRRAPLLIVEICSFGLNYGTDFDHTDFTFSGSDDAFVDGKPRIPSLPCCTGKPQLLGPLEASAPSWRVCGKRARLLRCHPQCPNLHQCPYMAQ